jgi:hypothetical protein
VNLKRTYYDDFSSLAQEYGAQRSNDIDSIIEDFTTASSNGQRNLQQQEITAQYHVHPCS